MNKRRHQKNKKKEKKKFLVKGTKTQTMTNRQKKHRIETGPSGLKGERCTKREKKDLAIKESLQLYQQVNGTGKKPQEGWEHTFTLES